jgi:glyoxylase-like metal-dependent hydrolase (beta-lactamase superfamily II)
MINQICVGALETNCLIVPLPAGVRLPGDQSELKFSDKCILMDPGAEAEVILLRLKTLRLIPRYIVISHAHWDHVAALPEVAASYPDAEIAIHREEAGKLGPNTSELHLREFIIAGGTEALFKQFWSPDPLPQATLLLEEGSTIGPFTVLHLPGHSPGSIGLLWEEQKILLSGDTMFRAGAGRTDLPGGNWQMLYQSLERLYKLDEETRVYPGHGENTIIRDELPGAGSGAGGWRSSL